jgi:hypothetical protein
VRNLFFILAISIVIQIGCGGSSDDKKDSSDSANTDLSDKVKMQVFGKSIYLADDLYQLSCNHYYFNFTINDSNHDCKATSVAFGDTRDPKTDQYLSTWEIKSPDNAVDIKGTVYDDVDQVHIGDKIYYCLLYAGASGAWGQDGSEIYSAGHLVLSEKAATKPSELEADKIIAVGIDDQDFCAARF